MDCKHISTSLSIYRKLHFYSSQSCYKCLDNTPVINQSLKPYGDRQWEQNLTFSKALLIVAMCVKFMRFDRQTDKQLLFPLKSQPTHGQGGGLT